jgi:AFG3 family protein
MDTEEQKNNNPKNATPRGNGNNNDNKSSYVWIYIVLAIITGLLVFNNVFSSSDSKEIYRTDFDAMYTSGDVVRVETINGQEAIVQISKDSLGKAMYKKLNLPTSLIGKKDMNFVLKIGSHESFQDHVDELKKTYNLKEINVVPKTESNAFLSILGNFFPIILLIGFYLFAMRKMGGGQGGFPGGGIFSVGKSKATMVDKDTESSINFSSVAGLDEAKLEVMEIVDFLKEPKKYTTLGGKIPKGALLIGPPGTGKTLLAKAMAGEAKVPFFSISGSDFVEMFVGVGASRVRDLFKQAREKSPCIIFIDEIDAIGRARGKSMVGGNDERESTLNQLLVEMDGFGGDTGIIMIAATNRPDVLDDALLRPGRFDRQISIDRPDLKGREQIFNVHLQKIKTHEEVSSKKLATQTPGFVGADIANICNEAALIAARSAKTAVEMVDFIAAIDRVIGGLEKKNKLISPEEKKIIAYHEAGHAICGWFLEHAHPLVKVTIVPRGVAALGYAQYLPKEKYLSTKEEIMDDVCMTLGGRASEKLVFGKISTGAYSDLEQTTQRIYALIVAYGMSDKVGHVNYQKMIENSYQAPYSNDTAKLIDEEIRTMAEEQFQRAIRLLSEKREELEKLANMLLEREVLNKEDLQELFGKRPWDADEEEIEEADTTILAEADTKEEVAPAISEEDAKVEDQNTFTSSSDSIG